MYQKLLSYLSRFSALLLLLVTVFKPSSSNSQTTITLGTGTSTSTTYGLVGINTYYEDSRAQYLIRAANITAAGGFAGNITAMALYVSGQPGRDMNGFNIKMKTTAATTATTTFESGATVVYSANPQPRTALTSGGWRTFTFATPFFWDGTSNVIVEICFDNSGYTSGGGVRVYNPGYTTSSYEYDDGSSGCTMSASSTSASRPQMQLTIVAAAACSGTPNATTASANPVQGCASSNFALTASGLGAETGYAYQWETSSTPTGPWSNLAGATTLNATTSTAATAYYRLKTTCSNSGAFSYSSVTSYAVVPCLNIPTTGNITVACGTNVSLYDNGGPSGNYVNNSSGYAVLEAEIGGIININGTYVTESGWDYVRIYNGVGTGGTLLQQFTGSGNINYTGAVGQTLTVQFYSDGSTVAAGCALNISYTGVCSQPCTGTPPSGTATISASQGCSSSNFTLNVTNFIPASDMSYQWQSAPSASGPWVNINDATTRTYQGTAGTTAGTTYYRLFVNCDNSGLSEVSSVVSYTVVPCRIIPQTGSIIVDCGDNTTLYDNGGPTGDYLPNSSGYAVLDAGVTGQITISGTYLTESTTYDGIRIYRNSGPSGTQIPGSPFGGTGGGTINYTGAVGETLTVQFYSDGSLQYSGFALNVSYAGECYPTCVASVDSASNVVLCEDGPATLTAAGNTATTQYRWYTSPSYNATPVATTPTGTWTTPNITATTTYYVSASNGSCISHPKTPIIVTRAPRPSAGSIIVTPSTPVNMCNGDSVSLFGFYPTSTGAVFTETFETNSPTVGSWTQQFVSGNTSWTLQTGRGTGGGGPTTAHGGTRNYHFYLASSTANVTRLISPVFDISSYSAATLTYWYANASWAGDINSLRVYYRTSATGAWVLLETITAAAANWTQRTVNLPNGSATYQIAFEGTNAYGYPLLIDDVSVTGTQYVYTYSWSSGAGSGLPSGAGTLDAANTSVWAHPVSGGSGTSSYTYTITVSNGYCTSTKNAEPVVVLDPSSVITAQGPTRFCQDDNVVLHASSNIGTTYRWYRVGIPDVEVGTGQDLTVTTGGDYYAVASTASPYAVCSKRSNTITVTVVANVEPAVTISSNYAGDSLCAGQTMQFHASVVNGGATPTYNWLRGAAVVGTGPTYSYVPVPGDAISLRLTSAAECPVPATVTSNVISPDVKPVTVPTISISASANNVCAGTEVTYTSTISNVTYTPQYQWYRNSQPVAGANDAAYTYSPSNGDIITCAVLSTYMCSQPGTVTSAGITMTVFPLQQPTVSIVHSPSANICDGSDVSFSVNSTNTGTAPVYTWYRNGVEAHVGSTWLTSTLNNEDTIVVNLSSNALCASPAEVKDTTIITVNPNLTPGISISANPADSICAGTCVTFTATAVNSGATPAYTWYRNNAIISGAANSTYTVCNLGANELIRCRVTSSAPCRTQDTAYSNELIIRLKVPQTPAVSIAASPNGAVCAGTEVRFVASPTNGGANPTYEWFRNGTSYGPPSASNTYTTSSFDNGDVITCRIRTSLTCVTADTVRSNGITMQVTALPVATISSTSGLSMCEGDSIVLTAAPAGGGYSYVWKRGGAADTVVGIGSTYTARTAGRIRVEVTNNSTLCTGVSAESILNVNPLPNPVITYTGTDSLCSGDTKVLTASPGGSYTYTWRLGAAIVGTDATYTATQGGSYTLEVRNQTTGCSRISDTLRLIEVALPVATLNQQGSSSFCEGDSVVLSTSTVGNYRYVWLHDGDSVGSGTRYVAREGGTYTIRVIDLRSGCYGEASTASPIVVYPLPNTTITASGTFICSGQSITLTSNATGNVSYRWYKNGIAIVPAATGSTYTVTEGGVYTVEVVNLTTGCRATTATGVNISEQPAPNATIMALSSTTFCEGDSVVLQTNPNGNATFQWQLNNTNIAGATNGVYTARVSGTYRVIVTQGSCSAVSDNVLVTATPLPVVSISNSGNNTLCLGQTRTLSTPQTPGHSYQWFRNGDTLHGSSDNNYTASQAGDYRVAVTNPGGCTQYSGAISLTYNSGITAGVTTTGSLNFCEGESVWFSSTVQGAGYSYGWYNGSTLVGNGAGYVATQSGSYTLRLTHSGGCIDTSLPQVVTVYPVPVVSVTANGNTTICTGGNGVELQTTATPGGSRTTWYRGNDSVGQGSTYRAMSAGAYHVRVITAEGCSTTSGSININVVEMPNADIISSSRTNAICGQNGILVLNAHPGSGSQTYQWYMNGNPINGANQSTYLAGQEGIYQLRVTRNSACTSTGAEMLVGRVVAPVPVIRVEGNKLIVDAVYSSYQWYYNNTAVNGATASSYTVQQGGYYSVRVVDDNDCSGMNSSPVYMDGNGLGVESVTVDNIRIYPNPVTDRLRIDAPVSVQVSLRTIDGKEILWKEHVKELDLGDVANGVYMLRIMNGKGELLKVERLVKQSR